MFFSVMDLLKEVLTDCCVDYGQILCSDCSMCCFYVGEGCCIKPSTFPQCNGYYRCDNNDICFVRI